MTSINDILSPALNSASSIFGALDSVNVGDSTFTLFDLFLASAFLAITLEFVFAMFEVDVDFWDYIFGGDDD